MTKRKVPTLNCPHCKQVVKGEKIESEYEFFSTYQFLCDRCESIFGHIYDLVEKKT